MQEADAMLPFSDTAAMQTTLTQQAIPWWSRHPWLTALFTGIVIILIATFIGIIIVRRDQPPIYHSQAVVRGTLQQQAYGAGPILAQVYDANFAALGRVSTIAVTIGTIVKQGDQLAQLDGADLQDALTIANRAVTAAQVTYNVASQNFTMTQQQTTADLALAAARQQGAVTACNAVRTCIVVANQAYAVAQAQANRQVSAAQGQVNATQSNLGTAQAQVDAAQHNWQHATLYASHDGTIAAINGTIGTQVSNTTTLPFIQIADVHTLHIVIQANELDISTIAKDNPATFTIGAFGDKQFHGTVSTIAPLGTITNLVTTYAVTIDIDMQAVQSVKILPGMTASAKIITADRPNVVLLPVNAITYAQAAASKNTPITQSQAVSAQVAAVALLNSLLANNPDSSSDHPAISYVVVKQKKMFVVRPIVIGFSDGIHVEVLAGLNEGEQVITGQEGTAPPIATPRTTPTPLLTPTISSSQATK